MIAIQTVLSFFVSLKALQRKTNKKNNKTKIFLQVYSFYKSWSKDPIKYLILTAIIWHCDDTLHSNEGNISKLLSFLLL